MQVFPGVITDMMFTLASILLQPEIQHAKNLLKGYVATLLKLYIIIALSLKMIISYFPGLSKISITISKSYVPNTLIKKNTGLINITINYF